MKHGPPRIVKNILWNWTHLALNLAAALYVTPLLLRQLGDTSYGAWVLLGSVLGYYSFLNFGVDTAVLRFVSKHLAEGQVEEAHRVIRTSRTFFRLVGVAVALLSLGMAAAIELPDPIYRSAFHLNNDLRRPFALGLALLGVGLAAAVFARVSLGVLRAKERYDLVNIINMCVLTGRTLAIVFFMGDSLVALCCIFAAANVAGSIGYSLTARSVLPLPTGKKQPFDWTTFQRVRHYGLFAFLNFMADQIRFYTDAIVIGLFLRLNYIAYYNLGNMLINYFRNVISNLSGPFLPVFSRYHGANNHEATRTAFLRASRITAFLAVLAAGNLVGTGLPFLEAWVGDSLGRYSIRLAYGVMLILLLPMTIELIESIATSVIYAKRQHHRLSMINGGEALANLGLSLLLVHRFGIIGVAVGTAIPLLVTRLVFLPPLACRLTGISTSYYAKRCIGIPLLYGASLGATQILLYQSLDVSGYLSMFAVSISTTLIVALPFFHLYFSREERFFFARVLLSVRELWNVPSNPMSGSADPGFETQG